MRIALTGNPNSGKTTMFNALTGRNEKVGNWAGVTVDKKENAVKKAYAGSDQLPYRIFSCSNSKGIVNFFGSSLMESFRI